MAPPPPTPPRDRDPSGVQRCLRAIREMVLTGALAPGQKVHQAELADELRVSRVPVREALARLSAEGLLRYRPNVGFAVVRFNPAELSEIYLMRRVLETEILRDVDPRGVDLDALTALNDEMRTVDHRADPELYQRLNVEFHYRIFAASSLSLVRSEVERLWNMSAYYRSLHLFVMPDTTQLSAEHELIVAALRAGDLVELVAVSDRHRAGTERVRGLLSPAAP